MWSALYVRNNNTSINVNDTAYVANEIAAEQPACASVSKMGRAFFGDIHGVLIRWRKTNCRCDSFFEEAVTTLYDIELHVEKKRICRAEIGLQEITTYEFGCEDLHITCVDFNEDVDVDYFNLVTITMPLENKNFANDEVVFAGKVDQKLLFLSSNSDDFDQSNEKYKANMKRSFGNSQNSEATGEGSSSNANATLNNNDFLRDEGTKVNHTEKGGPSRKRKRTSPMWQHFSIKFSEEENEDFAHCNYCLKKFNLGGKSNRSTGNLIKHLKADHSDKYSPKIEPSQGKFEFSQERYREALITWIVNSDQPFCTCKQEDFVELLKTLNPEATPLSAQTIKRDIMKKFEESVSEIKSKLCKVSSKFAFTVDAWTSKNVLPFMNIRAHWIDDDCNYQSVIVDFAFIQGNHSGENLCKIFVDCLKTFEIPLSKVSAITMDNVFSNDTFMEFLQKHGIVAGIHISSSENRVRCLPHVLNLAVQDVLSALKIPLNYEEDQYAYLDHAEDNEELYEVRTEEEEEYDEDEEEPTPSNCSPTVPKIRKLIKKIRKSAQMRQKLHKVCTLYEIKYLTPIIDVVTRWDSTFDMLERAIYLKVSLGVMCSKEKSLTKLLITDGEWNELNSLRSLLEKFRRSTKFMSMERHPTICAYLPTVDWIIESTESFIRNNPGPLKDAAGKGLAKLKKYQHEFQLTKCKIPYIAVFLNPALKLNYFKEHGYTNASIRDIQRSICEVFENNYGGETNDNVENANEEAADEFLTHMYKRSKTREPKEFQKYLNHPLSNEKVDTLEYWRSNKNEFPNLSKMAQDYLPVQGSSTPVERDFSMGSHLVTPTRCSLHPQTIRACMCLKSWCKKSKSCQPDVTENQNYKKTKEK